MKCHTSQSDAALANLDHVMSNLENSTECTHNTMALYTYYFESRASMRMMRDNEASCAVRITSHKEGTVKQDSNLYSYWLGLATYAGLGMLLTASTATTLPLLQASIQRPGQRNHRASQNHKIDSPHNLLSLLRPEDVVLVEYCHNTVPTQPTDLQHSVVRV